MENVSSTFGEFALYKRRGSKFFQCRFRLNGREVRRSCATVVPRVALEAARLWVAEYERRARHTHTHSIHPANLAFRSNLCFSLIP